MKLRWRRFIPLFVLIGLMLLAYFFELGEYFSFEKMKENREILSHFVSVYPLAAPFLFILIYAVSTALSIPGGIFLSILGGFLFPQPFATIYIVCGATTGAVAVFLVASTALGDNMRKKAGTRLQKMRTGFQEDAAHYLLFLRLVPLFPFWLVNIAPAFFGVSLFTYTWTTFVGIIPGAFVFAQAGAGLGAVFDSADTFSLDAIFNTQAKIALIALGIFALLPVVVKKIRRRTK